MPSEIPRRQVSEPTTQATWVRLTDLRLPPDVAPLLVWHNWQRGSSFADRPTRPHRVPWSIVPSMSHSWNLAEGAAIAIHPPWRCELDPQHPERGLTVRGLDSRFWENARLFGFQARSTFSEAYTRGDDLVLTGQPLGDEGVRTVVYYRSPASATSASAHIAGDCLDVQFSVQTDRLDENPRMWVEHRFEAPRVLGLDGSSDWTPTAGQAARELSPEQGGCLLLVAADETMGCGLIAHPDDVVAVELVAEDSAAVRRLVVRQALFPDRLEKGVLVRARLRLVILPPSEVRETAVRRVRAAFEDLLAMPLPLTT